MKVRIRLVLLLKLEERAEEKVSKKEKVKREKNSKDSDKFATEKKSKLFIGTRVS